MKSTGTTLSIICMLTVAGLAIGVAVERRARSMLDQENQALRQQLSQMDSLVAENRRLSNLVAQATGPQARPNGRLEMPSRPNELLAAPSTTDERWKELLRLRGEVDVLRQQRKEIETLREDTRQVRAAQESGLKSLNAGQAAKASNGMAANGSQLEILQAEYWTDNARMDVAEELRERIRGDSLKAIASNSIKGDPEFGQVKHLTVVYRFGGITMTNEFREDDFVVLPRE